MESDHSVPQVRVSLVRFERKPCPSVAHLQILGVPALSLVDFALFANQPFSCWVGLHSERVGELGHRLDVLGARQRGCQVVPLIAISSWVSNEGSGEDVSGPTGFRLFLLLRLGWRCRGRSSPRRLARGWGFVRGLFRRSFLGFFRRWFIILAFLLIRFWCPPEKSLVL